MCVPYRQESIAQMALYLATADAALGPMGDALSRLVAGEATDTGARQLLRHYGQPRHPYLLHDRATHMLLVWLCILRKGVRGL